METVTYRLSAPLGRTAEFLQAVVALDNLTMCGLKQAKEWFQLAEESPNGEPIEFEANKRYYWTLHNVYKGGIHQAGYEIVELPKAAS